MMLVMDVRVHMRHGAMNVFMLIRALFNRIVGETRLCGTREFPAICGVQPGVSDSIGQEMLSKPHLEEERTMEIIRREFLRLSSLTVTVPSIANIALAQAQA